MLYLILKRPHWIFGDTRDRMGWEFVDAILLALIVVGVFTFIGTR